MARLNPARSNRASTEDSFYRNRTPTVNRAVGKGSLSPSPVASLSSDKENHGGAGQRVPASDKSQSQKNMALPRLPAADAAGPNKRRRLADAGSSMAGRRREDGDSEDEDLHFYNPNQDPEERKRIRQGMRDNLRKLHENQEALLKDDGSGLIQILNDEQGIFDRTKQTSDATEDAKMLNVISELTLKKAQRMAFGEQSAVGIDVDEFISKCITFMRNGRPLGDDEEGPGSTQTHRNRRRNAAESDEEEGDAEDALPWHVLGERACFPNNRRPAVPSFLLGPLSVQKRLRATQRQARQRRDSSSTVTKPQSIEAQDLERTESNNLTKQCERIRDILDKTIAEGTTGVEASADDDMEPDEARALFRRNRLATNWQVSLFEFAINPKSFGQTVENLFYISFLIKDGFLTLDNDDDGMPTLRPSEPKAVAEQHERGAARHQAIFSIDWTTWEMLKRAFDLTNSTVPLIPHRNDEADTQINTTGWYN